MKASDAMESNPVTVAPATAIADAVHLMVTRRISSLPVVNEFGEVVGMVSEGDLLRRVELGTAASNSRWLTWLGSRGRAAREYVRSHARRVREVMTAAVVAVAPDTELSEVVFLMESRHIKRIPVLENGRLIGIITRWGLMRVLEGLLPRASVRPVDDEELRRRLLSSVKEQSWAPRTPFDLKVANGVVEFVGVVTDERERTALRVLAENTPGVRSVVDHLLWVDLMSGVSLDPQPWDRADEPQRNDATTSDLGSS
ncbi:MAG TPA: CBS domain-containing protein [Steroidobacteraceae bacterium]|jgi:CBS domain-containing protein|nr:CBS domain-containing protein [Steroidobacteraceae bacterium]